MLKILGPINSSIVLQSLIDAANKDEIGGGESSGNKANLSNLCILKRSTGAGYLTFESAKKGGDNPKKDGGNTKKDVKAAKGFHYLIPDTKKVFNYLWHAFTQAPILQHFDPEWHIWIETDASSYAINGVLS